MFKELLKKEFVILDGGMGTMLQQAGMAMGEIPELLNLKNPELITGIHQKYIEAGSDIVYANTFGANRYKLQHCEKSVNEIIEAGIRNARKACENSGSLVALDIGPIGQLLEPTGYLSFEEAYDIFKEQILAGKEADLIVFETMTDLMEVKAGVLAAKENSSLPVLCTMTFEEDGRTFTGCSVSSMALTLEGLGVDAIGINCSLGPKELLPVVKELSRWTTLPIVVKPNAGLPNPVTNTYDVTPEEFAEYAREMVSYGVKIMGGCCGTNPDFIRALSRMLSGEKFVTSEKKIPAAVCSATKTVVIDQPRIIGERINPTGKKLFKEALLKNDMDYILNQALEQQNGGADILDVNVGLPGIDEKEMMIRAVRELQGVVELPLQIDTTKPDVLEAALRVYNGKPIVNSVNGEEKSLSTVLPLVKKYGAAVVGLALDENGISKSADDRFAIAQKIMNRALEYGIRKEDIYIDCLTLTASAEQEGVMETLKALKRVKDELGLKTVLGVSNISFGLPDRELINHNFLTMALTHGLDLPIINPNVASMTGAVRAYKLLTAIDKDSMEYIAAYNEAKARKEAEQALSANTGENVAPDGRSRKEAGQKDLVYAVETGLKNEAAKITEELLKTMDTMEIINTMLIPALDKTGELFEKGKIFLPQLILSAQSAQAAFEVIKKNMVKSRSGDAGVDKGTVVIATVKGDIHDIGKNIVKVLLENYGYHVVDLGKDVDYQAVVDAVKQYDAKLVGLSALMTTTLVSMEKTIELIHENQLDCKIMVGGAVLTPEYAVQIGADYYVKDAKESIDVAKKILG